jgi:hypothetical protein
VHERYADQFALTAAEKQLKQRESEIEQLGGQIEQQDVKLRANAQQISSLSRDLEDANIERERLEVSLRLMKVDHRLARIEVLRQEGSAEENDLVTEFSFGELDAEGRPLGQPEIFRIEGDLAYIDAWVVKFTDEHVESGDPLRATSICLFRRVFGDRMSPSEGFALDKEGAGPMAYRSGGQPSEFERELWSRFWDLAGDPDHAAELGIRAMHGEAPYVKLRPGRSYRVQLRASDGLSIVPEDPAESETAPRQPAT